MEEFTDLFRGFVPFGMDSYKSVIELVIILLVCIFIVAIIILCRVDVVIKNQEKQIKENKKTGNATLL